MSNENDWKETKGIPLDTIISALQKMEYGSEEKVMFCIRFLLGCRGSEMDKLYKSKLYGNSIYWKLGKSQTGWRKEVLPDDFIQELKTYWANCPTKSDRFFGKDNTSFNRIFNRDIRPMLGGKWLEKHPCMHNLQTEQYTYQLNGLRKDSMTMDFRNNWIKYGDANVALLMTQKRWKHKTPWMTCAHYILEFDRIGLKKSGTEITPSDIYSEATKQRRILDYLVAATQK